MLWHFGCDMGFGMIRLLLLQVFAMVLTVHAQFTFHIYSPWASDPLLVNNRHHVQGGFSDWSANDRTKMTAEGDGWYSFTIPGTLTDWWDITLKNCPIASDQNCNGGQTWAIKPKVVTLMGGEKEVWVIPDASSTGYHIDLIPPGAKVVWFKSPWGNKSLPNMIVGSDTVRMRYSTDQARCGWYKGALVGEQITSGEVYFQQAHTDVTLPKTGTLSVSVPLATSDTVFVDGLLSPLAAATTAGSAGTCIDTARVVHILHPWESDPNRQELPVYVRAGNILGNYKAMDSTGEYKGWWKYEFTAAQYAHSEFKTANLEFRSYYPAPEQATLTYASIKLTTLFPAGEYEVWILPENSTYRIIRAPLRMMMIHIMNPFEGTVPRMLLDGDTVRMKAISDTCGWYRTTLYEAPSSWRVYFKQALGSELYSQEGLVDSSAIDLDSLMSMGSSAWIKPNPYPTGAAELYSAYPGPPGECPNRNLAVMVFDRHDNEVDFQNPSSGCGGHWTGMVQPKLVNGNLVKGTTPVQVEGTGGTCNPDIDSWFKPIVLAGGKNNATCYDLPLALDPDGFWLADFYESKAKNMPGFFPIDDFKYLDSAKTIANPNFSLNGDCSGIGQHNFHFTMHVNAEFKYVPGQYFDFRGDDDVWVFINDSLVVDIGGVHGPIGGSVNVDSLGLVPGQIYPFDIFFAERNTCGSNFKMRTSMDLKTDRSYFSIVVNAGAGIISHEIWQILKEQSLSCDFASTAKADTVKAASNFYLYGPMFPDGPKTLTSGVNYGGISINADYNSFSIDTNAIVRDRSLAPGRYRLEFVHSVDPKLKSDVTFVVPAYPLPAIVFTDSLGNVILPDTVSLGEWAFQPYPVYIQARYVGVPCEDCSDLLSLKTSDSLIFLDQDQRPIQEVRLDSGRAVIWVMGLAALDSASFKVGGSTVQNELIWKNIQLKEPPVPFVKKAQIFDRDGNGVGDSLRIHFSKALVGKDAADSLFWDWGDLKHALKKESISKVVKDSTLVLVGDSLAQFLFTGSTVEEVYQGNVTTWFTYKPTEGADSGKTIPFGVTAPISDRIGALILEAEVAPGRMMDTLFLTFSESLDSSLTDSAFEFKVWRNGVEQSALMKQLFSANLSHF